MVTLFIEDKPYEAPEGRNLLEAVLTLGFDLPYFCWHPALHAVGACRQCAVKQFRDEEDKKGSIIMACMTPVRSGMRISIDDPEAKEFRAAVIGWLMTNHPHDCPICDEGGECHLQDMTVMTGHTYREYRFNKRTFRNQYLGPFINHEMNRCIQCYRCVRFYRDHAGGKDLNVFASRNKTYFGRSREGVLESPFSGNLVEICPTGVFTDKTLKARYTRKWDLQTAPSVCMLCGLGCNTLPGERYGSLRRTLNRYNGEVNGYFLCDRGRFGYEFVNSSRRIKHPMVRESSGEEKAPRTVETASVHVAELLFESKRAIGIGSARASLEANFALRTLVGQDNFFIGTDQGKARSVSTLLQILREGPARTPSLGDVEQADAILILGEDLTNTAPLLDLKLRQAVRNRPREKSRALKIPDWNDAFVRLVAGEDRGSLFIATPAACALDEIASGICRAAPEDVARLGFAVAHLIDPTAPEVKELQKNLSALAGTIASELKDAKRPLVIAGLGAGDDSVLHAAANVAWALKKENPDTALCFTVPECNTLGAGLLDAGDLTGAFEAMESGGAETVIILENDLFEQEDGDRVSAFLDKASRVIALDHLENKTTARADVVLPVATFAECGGTVVNSEGRAQRYFQVFMPKDGIRASWRWLFEIRDLGSSTGIMDWEGPEDVARSLAGALAVFKPLKDLAPQSTYRSQGGKVPRQPHRYSGRTAMQAHIDVSESGPPDDPESPLAFSMEGALIPPPAPLISRYWSPGWNSVQALNKFQEEVGGPLRGGDPGVRLIEPAEPVEPVESVESVKPIKSVEGNAPAYFEDIPKAFPRRRDGWLVVPVHHLFGSETLSLETKGVAELAPAPYVALHPEDGSRLGFSEGDILEVEINGHGYSLPLKLEADLQRGCAGIPEGIPDLAVLKGRVWAKMSRKQ